MRSKVKQLIDAQGKNPHVVSMETGITYRLVLRMYNDDYIRPDTRIYTLQRLAIALGVGIDDLYEYEETA